MSRIVVAPRLDEVQVTEARSLWLNYLPLGKLAIVDGDPDQGKSLMSLDLAARLTTGGPWPDGTAIEEPGNVILVNCEDPLRDTVLPRLLQLGADPQRIVSFQGFADAGGKLATMPVFPHDVDALGRLIEQSRARLAIIDPLMAFIAPEYSSINDQMIRQALMPLVQMAEDLQCAVLAIRHLNKSGAGRAIYRGSGSIGIVGCSRIAFLAGRSPDDPSLRVLACLKSNLGPKPPSLGFRIVKLDRLCVEWAGPVDYSAEDLVAGPGQKATAQERAGAFVREQLKDGPLAVAMLEARGRGTGLGERSLRKARQALGVIVTESGPATNREHMCALPQADSLAGLLARPAR